MPDKNIQTSRFALQKIGDGRISATAGQTAADGNNTSAHVFEPGDYNALLAFIEQSHPDVPGPNISTLSGTAGTGVVAAYNAGALQRLRLTLSAVSIAVTNAHKYGGTQVWLWPNTNIIVLSARMNLTVTKDGVGILAADAPHIALGSATASNTTLATTMIDTIEQVTMAGSVLAELAQKNGPHTAGNRYIAAGASNALFLNAGTTGNTGAVDGSLLASGTIDVWFIDTGTFGP